MARPKKRPCNYLLPVTAALMRPILGGRPSPFLSPTFCPVPEILAAERTDQETPALATAKLKNAIHKNSAVSTALAALLIFVGRPRSAGRSPP